MKTATRRKQIPGFSKYSVTDKGDVYSYLGTKPRKLKPLTNNCGYHQVNLYDDKGARKAKLVSRLVLETFLGKPASNMDASHIDGDRTNNKLSNLVFESHSANINRHIVKRKKVNKINDLTEQQQGFILQIIKNSLMSVTELSQKTGITQSAISKFCGKNGVKAQKGRFNKKVDLSLTVIQ